MFLSPCEAGRMRNSSPSKSLKIEIMDGAFFRGLGKNFREWQCHAKWLDRLDDRNWKKGRTGICSNLFTSR
jgi:hypothetical protein